MGMKVPRWLKTMLEYCQKSIQPCANLQSKAKIPNTHQAQISWECHPQADEDCILLSQTIRLQRSAKTIHSFSSAAENASPYIEPSILDDRNYRPRINVANDCTPLPRRLLHLTRHLWRLCGPNLCRLCGFDDPLSHRTYLDCVQPLNFIYISTRTEFRPIRIQLSIAGVRNLPPTVVFKICPCGQYHRRRLPVVAGHQNHLRNAWTTLNRRYIDHSSNIISRCDTVGLSVLLPSAMPPPPESSFRGRHTIRLRY